MDEGEIRLTLVDSHFQGADRQVTGHPISNEWLLA
jgi:hypothetical protein